MKILRAGFELTGNPLFGWMYPLEVEDRAKQQMLNIEASATLISDEHMERMRRAFGCTSCWVCACVGRHEGQPLNVKVHPSFKTACEVCGCAEFKGEVNTSGIECAGIEGPVEEPKARFNKIEAKDFWSQTRKMGS